MNLIERIESIFRNLFSASRLKKALHEGVDGTENLVALVRAAQEDTVIRKTILTMASVADEFHRRSLISETQRDLKLRGAPSELIEAFGFLKDSGICKKVIEVLDE